MRRYTDLNGEWSFTDLNGVVQDVTLPHTWNNVDGQDGGNDYKRGTCTYEKQFSAPEQTDAEEVWIEFQGVNASADVELNGQQICHHDGGYSTFRANITKALQADNRLTVKVDNSVNTKVYPQKADFTFYGGIYRSVRLVTLSNRHFALEEFGGPGIKVTPIVEGDAANIRVESHTNCTGEVYVSIADADGLEAVAGKGGDISLSISHPHLWDGLKDPYMYTATATLIVDGEETDRIQTAFGIRSFHVDPQKGFILNGRHYPLHGVSRHQDRRGIGNALSKADHDEDMALIKEMGCNTVRLAHYQHDQYFYDLCDQNGMIVWAEIPYISAHMPDGRENTISQMQELITQNYNHPSIVCWGVSNEITIATKDKKDMLDNHRVLNELCHKMDPIRFTTLACYAVCGPFNKSAHITDVVSWNLYLGWYVPGLFLNDLWVDFFHFVFPKRPLGYSEYGAEAMPNLHSSHPRRGDHSEEYQCVYHEYLLRFFEKRPWMWATHVWNMFDFAADARNQGGEPGMNHKGLVTFDRQIKKDSFYLYKAWWSKEPFVHICSKRYTDRNERNTLVKIYSNQKEVSLYADGQLVGKQTGNRVFEFHVPLNGEVSLKAVAGDLTDETVLRYVEHANPAYKLSVKSSNSANWV